jgi:hypothetical protein
MSKLFTYITILTAIILAGNGCSVYDNNPTGYNPNQRTVKSVTKWQCNLTTGDKVIKLNFKEFDKNGYLTHEEFYTTSGKISYESIFSYNGYISNEKVNYFNSNGSIDSTKLASYFYDTKGNITQKITFNALGDTLNIFNYVYNTNGNLIKKSEFETNGNLKSEINYSYNYDVGGKIVSVYQNSSNDGLYLTKDSVVYLPENKKIEKITFDSQGKIQSIRSFYYDKYGNTTTELETLKDGTVLKKFVYDYEFY